VVSVKGTYALEDSVLVFEAFVVELLFVPVVLGEELVEGAFALGWKDFACDARPVLLLTATRPVA
jgi:hypothetical protein